MTPTDQQIVDHIRLARSRSIGPVTFHKLIEKHETAPLAIDALLDGPNAHKVCSLANAEQELEAAHAAGLQIVLSGTTAYPHRLAALSDAPPLLYWRGNSTLFEGKLCAIVGARNASGAGRKITSALASDMGKEGIVIVSGMARGIDTAAHLSAMHTGTIACLAGGLDVIYPEENRDVYFQLVENGLLVSEMPPGMKPLARHFPRRNRIISGLSDGVLIVEAAARSGSLITARFAADQGRELFAVPGSPLDPRSAGANQLIKDGAILVRSAEDIFAEFPETPRQVLATTPLEATAAGMPEARSRHPKPAKVTQSGLLSLLSPSPLHVDEIVALSGQDAHGILAELQMLELEGKVARHVGARYSRID